MPTTIIRTAAALTSVLALALTGCGDNPDDTSTAPTTAPAPGSATPGTSGSAGPAPACLADSWRATGVSASGGEGNASAQLNGGAGTTITIGPDGMTDVAFTGSDPITFAAQLGGAQVEGSFRYDGAIRGAVRFEPGSGDTGTWNPDGTIRWTDLRGTVKLTKPLDVTLLDNASISDFTGDNATKAGGAVDLQPILRRGTYTCDGDTFRIETTENGPRLVWTFTRA